MGIFSADVQLPPFANLGQTTKQNSITPRGSLVEKKEDLDRSLLHRAHPRRSLQAAAIIIAIQVESGCPRGIAISFGLLLFQKFREKPATGGGCMQTHVPPSKNQQPLLNSPFSGWGLVTASLDQSMDPIH